MLSAERQQIISELVARDQVVNVNHLAQRFGVSESTIRRDLEQLEKQGLIRRIHGGAAAPGGIDGGSIEWPTVKDELSAGRIGRTTANRIRDNETIYLGPGRLTLETARSLVSRSRLTVITNSLEIAHWLANHSRLEVILTGGTVGRFRNGMAGPLVTHALRTLRSDRIIIEATGISPDQGLMGADLAQAELCRELINAPGEAIVLVPPERIGRVGGVWIGPASDVDVIITGREASDATLWDLSQLGIDIISV